MPLVMPPPHCVRGYGVWAILVRKMHYLRDLLICPTLIMSVVGHLVSTLFRDSLGLRYRAGLAPDNLCVGK